jgi:hypothetical protein
MSTPSTFFKFVSFERRDVIENGNIRFAPIGEFNDPFELEPVITPISRHFLKYCASLTKREIQEIQFTNEDLDYSSTRENLTGFYKEKYKDKVQNYGILSLSSNSHINSLLAMSFLEKKDPRENILMWSHYADSHRGFVIEFDKDFISEAELHKVRYSNERDLLTFEDIDDNDFHKVFYKKSEEWAYEQEYRAVLPLNKADDVKDNKYHLFKFRKKSVRSITFGCAMSQNNKDLIINMIENDSEYESVNFNHALLNDDDFCLQFYHTSGGWTNDPRFGPIRIPSQKVLTSQSSGPAKAGR